MHNPDCCPACMQTGTLIPLGTRLDHPHRWMPWVAVTTHLLLCDHCDALIETRLLAQTETRLPARDRVVTVGDERVLAISAA